MKAFYSFLGAFLPMREIWKDVLHHSRIYCRIVSWSGMHNQSSLLFLSNLFNLGFKEMEWIHDTGLCTHCLTSNL